MKIKYLKWIGSATTGFPSTLFGILPQNQLFLRYFFLFFVNYVLFHQLGQSHKGFLNIDSVFGTA